MIKSLGIYQEDKYRAEKERVQANLSKPRANSSGQSFADTPIQRAAAVANSDLSDDMRAQLFKEMNAARRGY